MNVQVDGLDVHAFLVCGSPSLAAVEESRSASRPTSAISVCKPLDQLSLLLDMSRKLLIGRTPIIRHHNMIDKPEKRLTCHAARHLTSYTPIT
jgi:hypothetical protein